MPKNHKNHENHQNHENHRKWRKPIIRHILDTFVENQPLLRSENDILARDVKSREKCDFHTFHTFHSFATEDSQNPPPSPLSAKPPPSPQNPLLNQGEIVIGPRVTGKSRSGQEGCGEDSPHAHATQTTVKTRANTKSGDFTKMTAKTRPFSLIFDKFSQRTQRRVWKRFCSKLVFSTPILSIFHHFLTKIGIQARDS